jgi:hypothetical protein
MTRDAPSETASADPSVNSVGKAAVDRVCDPLRTVGYAALFQRVGEFRVANENGVRGRIFGYR